MAGASSSEIRVAQALLSAQTGYRLEADGVWGPQTELVFSKASSSTQREVRAILARAGASPESVRTTIERRSPTTEKMTMSGLTGIAKQLAVKAAAAGITGTSLVNFLANVEVESGFQPKAEDHRYRPSVARSNLRAFKDWSDAQISELVKKGKTAFFEVAYGHKTTAGARLGNTLPGDGGLFYGRGLLQTTGRSNYVALDAAYPQLGVLRNPDVLISDINASMDAAIFFWKKNVMRVGADRQIRASAKAVNGGDNAMSERVASAAKFSALV